MWSGLCEAEEVAPEVDGDPRAGARMRDGVPAGRVDARGKGAAVQEGAGLVAAERGRGRVEPQHNGIVEQLDCDEADGGIERCGRVGEKIHWVTMLASVTGTRSEEPLAR